MQIYVVVFAVIAFTAFGTFLSQSTSQEKVVRLGPGESKFIAVQKTFLKRGSGTGVIEHVNDWINGDVHGANIQHLQSETGSASK